MRTDQIFLNCIMAATAVAIVILFAVLWYGSTAEDRRHREHLRAEQQFHKQLDAVAAARAREARR